MSVVVAAVVLAMQSPGPQFQLSVQAWTFHRFTAFEAIERTSMAGGKNIELFPGQPLRPESGVKVGPDMGSAAEGELKAQLSKFGVKAVAFGVVGISKNVEESRPLFAWAKRMGIGVINTESEESIATIETLVKEFDLRVGFHNHPGSVSNPNYRVWNPKYVYDLVKDRDSRIGACADTGHWVRSGIKPMDALKILKGRVVSSHLKDLNVFSAEGHDVPYGTGVSDIAGILRTYQKIGLRGPVSVEYEHNWETNVPEVANCLGYVRGFMVRE